MSVSLIDGHVDPDTNCMSLVEKIVIERNREIDNAVLGTIVNIANENGISITLNEKAIVNALEKQVPKKPHKEEFELCETCPVCGWLLECLPNYCEKCGQALDWSDTE
jgi:hypothetical protein